MPGPGSAILDLPARPPPVVAARPVPPVQPYPLTGQPGLPSGPASASGAGVYARPPGRETTAQGPADQVRTSTGTVLPLARGATVSQLLGGTTAPSSTAPNQSRAQGRGGTRSHYHPQQGPRSDYVMWCGNVPADATVEELWEIFSKLPPESDEVDFQLGSDAGSTSDKVVGEREGNVDNALDPATGASGHGVMSIFTISRSNCAFVNYATRKHLERAVRYFYGKPVRPNDPRCPKLVCRVRKKDDEAQAGVAGQRGRGMHVTWLKEHERKRKAAAQVISPSPVDIDRGTSTGSTTPRPAVSVTSPGSAAALAESGHLPSGLPATSGSETPTDKLLAPPDRPPISHVASSSSLGNESSSNQESSSGSLSYSSTNSSLFRHPAFRNRYFILKSLTDEELEQSVRTGLWATQPHNEPVLDQAFRNSENVILIFSANQSGEFFGYARMASPIKTDKSGEVAEQHRTGGGRPTTIVEVEDENGNDRVTHPILSPGSLPPHQVDGSTMIFSPSASMGPTSSPQPITPLNETLTTSTDDNNKKISDDSDKTVVPRPQPTSWPLTSTDRGDAAVGREKRGTTLSPKLLQSVPGPLRPELNAGPSTIEPKPSEASLVSQMSNMAVNREPTPRAEPDEFGVRRKDMASESSTPVTHATSPGDTGSLGPSDSASWGDARSEREAAVKAVIHNLRLEERESVRKVEQLEAQLQVSRMGANLASDTSGSDSWGTPFKVEWLHTRRLPFHAVRRLRNPWRDNRQVKVSRDGTELEPGVGAQLLQEWEKPAAEGNPGPRRRSDSSTLSKEGEEEDEEDGSDEG